MKGVAGVMAGGLTGALKPLMHKVAGAGLLVIALAITSLLGGCVTPKTCGPGEVELTHVSDRPYRWTGDFAALECRANRGDKKAQAVMGDIYQYGGMGEPIDLRRAKAWYGKAVSLTPGQAYVYTPPVGQEKTGRMIAVPKAVKSGNAYAQRQFALLSELPVGRKLSDAFVKYFQRVCFADGLPFSKNAGKCADILLSQKIAPLELGVYNEKFPPDQDRCKVLMDVLKDKRNYETIEVPFINFPTREDFARYVGKPADEFPVWPLHMALYHINDWASLGMFLGKGASVRPQEGDYDVMRPYKGVIAIVNQKWPKIFKQYSVYDYDPIDTAEHPAGIPSIAHAFFTIWITSRWDRMPTPDRSMWSEPDILIRLKPTKQTLQYLALQVKTHKERPDKSEEKLMPLLYVSIALTAWEESEITEGAIIYQLFPNENFVTEKQFDDASHPWWPSCTTGGSLGKKDISGFAAQIELKGADYGD